MGDTIRKRIANLLLSNKKHVRYLGVLACLALMVTLGVAMVTRQRGVAMTHEETVLDCHYAGAGAHTHDASCYDADGNLVCPLPEREAHVHDDSCYTETRTLVCGLEEGQELEDGSIHYHDDSCYEVTRELTCGKDEVTETHVHGPGCFRTVTVVDSTDLQMPAQEFEGKLKAIDEDGNEYVKVLVSVKAPEGALPEGTTMRVEAVDEDAIADKVEDAVKARAGEDATIKSVTAVDITFLDKDGNEVEPAKKVEVKITSEDVKSMENPVLVHVDKDDDKDAEIVSGATKVNAADDDYSTGNEDTVKFNTDQFSPYVIVELETLTGGFFTASGETLTVTVTYGPEALVPEGSSLEIREILPEDEDYATYYDATAEALEGQGIASMNIVDITIVGPNGEKVQPAVPVQVEASYINPIEAGEDPKVQIVHFSDATDEATEDETLESEVLDAEASTTEDGTIESVSFEATSFSVYSIASTAQSADNLDGKQFAIVNQFNSTAAKGTNLAGSNNTRLAKIGVTFTNNNSVVHTTSTDDITIWTFTSAGGSNTYFIQNESGQYLNIANGYVRVSDQSQAITVTPGSGTNRNNRFRFVGTGGYALNDFDNGALASGYGPYNDSGNNEWFRLYDLNQIDAIKVHYVTADGTEIAPQKLIGQTTKVDGATNYTDTYAFGDVYDLYQKIDGYAYQSTHLSSPTGTQINSEVIYSTADSYNIANGSSGNDHHVQNAHYAWMYQAPEPDTTHSSVTEYDINEFGNITDVYVVYAAGEETIPSHGGSGGGSGESLDEPKPKKTLTPNGDGTYEMSLSVNASSKPIDKTHGANVILIYDESASMGTRIADGRTRMEAARSAAKGIVEDLLKLNDGRAQGEELVEMMIISFSPGVNDVSSWATNANVLNNWIDRNLAVDSRGGTNWEAAVKRAYSEAQSHDDGDSTYVIFMTDGNPWRDTQENGHDAHIRNYMEKGSYIYATESARRIVKAGYELYGIGIYGNVDVLHSLLNFAYNGRSTYDPTENAYGHYYIAQQQDQLVQALSDIAGTIAGNLSMAGVEFKDGIAISTASQPDTTMTALHTTTVNGVPVLTGVKYSKSAGNATGSEAFTVTVGTNGRAMFSINGGTAVEGSIVSKTYDRIKDDASGTAPATANIYQLVSGGKTYEMPIATLSSDGDLDWDLAPLGTLEDGATYTITTTVWPDQEAYDLVTALNNGTAQWDENAATAVKDEDNNVIFWQGGASEGNTTYEHIVKYPDGVYAALSNTYQTLDYYVVDNEDGTITYKKGPQIEMDYPDPMGLVDENINLVKDWEKDMMPGAKIPTNVTVDLLRDGSPFITNILLEASKDWTVSKYIAPGLMINKASADAKGLTTADNVVSYNGGTNNYVILNDGHDYQFTEAFQRQFELEKKVYHPMLIDNVLTNVEFSEDGKTITPTDDDLSQGLIAKNQLKGGININKIVWDVSDQVVADSSELFDAQVVLNVPKDEDGNPDFHNVDKFMDGTTVVDGSVAWYAYYRVVDGVERRLYDSDLISLGILEEYGTDNNGYAIGTGTNHPGDQYSLYDSGWFMLDFDDETGVATGTVKILPGITLRFTNMAAGTTYSVEESTLPAGYELVSYRYEHVPYDNGVAQTPVVDTGTTHEVVVNQANNVTVTNRQVSSDLILIKTDENGNAITSANDTAKFKLTRNEAYDGRSATWVNAVDKNNKIVNGVVTVNSTDGVTLESLSDGIYHLEETASPNGYVVLTEGVYFRLNNGNVQFVSWEETTDPDTEEKTYTVTDIDTPAGYTIVPKTNTTAVAIKVANTPGSQLPNAGGLGTSLFTIIGSAVCTAAAMMRGFASRRRRERRFEY